MLRINKRAQGSLAVVITVLATFALCITALFLFSTKAASIEENLDVSVMEKVYSRATIINFYLDEISSEIKSSQDSLIQFKRELNNHKDKQGQYFDLVLIQIENQLNNAPSNHIYTENGSVFLNFEVRLSEVAYSSGSKASKRYVVKYVYNYTQKLYFPEISRGS
jgi:hypothetical protein